MTSPAILPAALRASLPVAFGYVPLGMAFGLLLVDSGQPGWLATLMGLIVFAGSAQFLAVGLLAAGTGLVEVFVTTLLLNSRHLFYGFSMLGRFSEVRGWRRLYLIFGLTDETYSLLTSTRPPEGASRSGYYLALTALNQGWWVLGCTAGALLGSAVTLDTRGMDFALTALFVVLAIEQWRAVREVYPFVAAVGAGAVALAFAGDRNFLLAALALTLLALFARYAAEKKTWTPST